MDFSFVRYLESKKTVDDRALNQQVWQTFWEALPGSSRQYPLEMLELGAGSGAMSQRILTSGKISTLLYTALDDQPENINELKRQSAAWLESRPFVQLFTELGNAEQYVSNQIGERYFDAILAHAFLDLVDLDHFLPQLLELLPSGGLGYFTINFDGDTIFQPSHPADAEILSAYHNSMKDSRSGSRLLNLLVGMDVDILAVGSSDWIVYPQKPTGSDQTFYPADEAYFLHHILSFFEDSVGNNDVVNSKKFDDWLSVRRKQIEDGELIFIAHQLDYVFRKR